MNVMYKIKEDLLKGMSFEEIASCYTLKELNKATSRALSVYNVTNSGPGCYKEEADWVRDILKIRLIKIRDKEAKKLGFKDYEEMEAESKILAKIYNKRGIMRIVKVENGKFATWDKKHYIKVHNTKEEAKRHGLERLKTALEAEGFVRDSKAWEEELKKRCIA